MWIRLYAALMLLLTPLLLVYLYWRGRKDSRYRQCFNERLGRVAIIPEQQGGLLIHTVSVGETLAAKQLIEHALRQWPSLPVTVSCMTPTARQLIEDSFADRVRCVYLPLDNRLACERFVSRLRPRAIWLLETEIWPCFMTVAQRHDIPVCLLNARLSARSAKGYRRVSQLMRPLWGQLAAVAAQDSASARRFQRLGVSAAALSVLGNLKFDVSLDQSQRDLAAMVGSHLKRSMVWLAASTHPGEHQQVIAAHQQLRQRWPELQLILAPRHPEQFASVEALLSDAQLSYQRRSQVNRLDANVAVILADSMGEMMLWGQLASISFIGGSLIDRGGHNPLELIACDSAVLSGKSVYNFAEVYRQLNTNKGVRWVDSCDTLADCVSQLLVDSVKWERQQQAAEFVLRQHQGATSRTLSYAAAATLTGSFMIKTRATKKEFIKYDESIIADCQAKHFSPKFWQQQKAIAGNSTGRATVWFIQQGDHGMLLRHYYRGGLVGKFNKDRFWREPAELSRAVHEFDLLVKLQELGLPVPQPIAARMVKAGMFSYRADILVEVIPGAVDVFRLLRETKLNAEQWQRLGAAVKQMHQKNVYHSDLNCHNLMLDDYDKAWIVDFDKCGIKQPGQWKAENLARLKRSLVKEKAKYDTFYWKQNRDWPEFLTGYEKA